MRFATASGAVYDIFDVEGQSYITRDCEIPVVDRHSGDDMGEIMATRVIFTKPPTVGERFHYIALTHGACVSTPVVSVEP